MDLEKMERLREKYRDAKGDEVFDPEFRRVDELLPGSSSNRTMQLLQGLSGLDVVGGDVVEIAPQYDATTNTVHVGAQLLFEVLALMILSPSS